MQRSLEHRLNLACHDAISVAKDQGWSNVVNTKRKIRMVLVNFARKVINLNILFELPQAFNFTGRHRDAVLEFEKPFHRDLKVGNER